MYNFSLDLSPEIQNQWSHWPFATSSWIFKSHLTVNMSRTRILLFTALSQNLLLHSIPRLSSWWHHSTGARTGARVKQVSCLDMKLKTFRVLCECQQCFCMTLKMSASLKSMSSAPHSPHPSPTPLSPAEAQTLGIILYTSVSLTSSSQLWGSPVGFTIRKRQQCPKSALQGKGLRNRQCWSPRMYFRHLAPRVCKWKSVFMLLWPWALANGGLDPQVSALEVCVPPAGPMGPERYRFTTHMCAVPSPVLALGSLFPAQSLGHSPSPPCSPPCSWLSLWDKQGVGEVSTSIGVCMIGGMSQTPYPQVWN